MKSIFISLALVALLGSSGVAQEGELQIIVNASNGVTRLTREQVRSVFLKKTDRWDNGVGIAPVDQSGRSRVRWRFCQQILGHQASWVERYWTEQIFTGRGTPPPVMASDEEVIAFVAEHDGAIGYVAARTELPEAVKVLRLEPEA
jgi:ABC-type phosphate transport system substrate-binding protein